MGNTGISFGLLISTYEQIMIDVVFQGVHGAYSEQAAFKLLGTEGVKTVGLDSFEKCFQAVNDGTATFALVPIENNQGGSIHANYDLQLRYNHFIVAELDFRVQHCLMVLPGVKQSDITKIWSHPQALAQCDDYIHRLGVVGEAAFDTAGSAEMIVTQQTRTVGAIASRLAAEYYGLTILEEGIEDDENNFTRFLLLSRKYLPIGLPRENPAVEMKTSLVFSLINDPGALVKALSAFSFRGVDFTKLESRPDKLKLRGHHFFDDLSGDDSQILSGDDTHILSRLRLDAEFNKEEEKQNRFSFIFYLDCLGSLMDSKLQNAVRQLSEVSPYLRVLGCYPTSGVLCDFVAASVGIPSGITMLDFNDIPSIPTPVPEEQLKIGILGFGNFGQFLAKQFAKSHKVFATSRSDYFNLCANMNVEFCDSVDTLFSKGIDCLVISVSILSFESVLRTIPLKYLSNVLVIDVLSVKMLPKHVMQVLLPPNVDILCTHPMFGPESGKYSWRGLPCVYEKVRLHSSGQRCERFLDIFRSAGCRMVEMSCEIHDEAAAGSQFVTHFTGRLLANLNLRSTPINTKGFETLLDLVDNTCKDSFDLFQALYQCNPNSSAQLDQFKRSMTSITDQLVSGATTTTTTERGLSSLLGRISPSKTSETHARALELKREGADIITTLTVGEPDFSPPRPILDAVTEAAENGHTRYTAVQGTFELRQAISRDYEERKNITFDPNTEILITHGGKQAIFCAVLALCEKGDEVIIPAPYWVSYPDIVRIADALPVFIERSPSADFILSPTELESVLTPKTRMLILCNPCNPTGCAYTGEQLEALAVVLRKPQFSHVIVLADEIYERLVYDGIHHVSFASIPGMRERTLIVNGFAKGYAMTGFRLGYLAGANRTVIAAATKLQSQVNSCASSISQYAGLAALTKVPESVLSPLYHGLELKRNAMVSALQAIPNVLCPIPKGAFYVFPDVSFYLGKNAVSPTTGFIVNSSTDLCKYLIEEHGLALPPGDAFGGCYGVRFSYAASMEDILEAVKRFTTGLDSLVFN